MTSSSSKTSDSVKRKLSDGCEKSNCRYGKSCYRTNPTHFEEFNHPLETDAKRTKYVFDKDKVSPKYFLTKVQGIDDCFNQETVAIGIEDILKDNHRELVESVQFSYIFDLTWLLKKYPASARSNPLLLVHGFTGSEKTEFEGEVMNYENIDLVQARLPIPYGTHHTKMMLLLYTNGLRIVIHTANLVENDWFQKTQGVWISPLFQKCPPGYCQEDDTFKLDLIEYLRTYRSSKLGKWITNIEGFDLTTANVHLIASVPGRYSGSSINKWGHLKLRKVLKDHGPRTSDVNYQWPVIGQFSSIGSLGAESSSWLTSEWLDSLSTCKDRMSTGRSQLKLIFPTGNNVRNSLEGYSAGGSLPYSVQTAMKQRYLKEYLNQWTSNTVGRTLAMPHVKSYTRVSPDCASAAWFLLTSANLSKAAWGAYEKNQSQFMIRSYEIGVLLTPKQKDESSALFSLDAKGGACEFLQLPFDVPLTPYRDGVDKPWVWDIKYTTEDSHGRLWIP
ncbi:tyrosyl-DNA phosphodiesterase 1-like [Hydractinia symbiolongicarpus]|uniref:tyrosyl-DNA phosphodiesterase 1-like n=1 Tax=Hydractinia symbiolongicarpus TaxID=13093 RepID=UPI00254A936B|nr:tyrosyl-DNA phosphodiesterase 1-like [Hydractinia symbiolongicarpus]